MRNVRSTCESMAQHTSPTLFPRPGDADEYKPSRWFCPMVSVTGGSRKLEVPADQINLGFVLGNKIAFGRVNANREYFETAVKDLSTAELQYPGWLKKLLTHPVKGLENDGEIMRILTETKGSIKAYCEVAEL